MELVLLVGANPRNIKRGPRVRLHEGKWRIRIEGQKDSTMNLHLHHETEAVITSPAIDKSVVVVNEPRTAELEIVNIGNEVSLTVFVELLT